MIKCLMPCVKLQNKSQELLQLKVNAVCNLFVICAYIMNFHNMYQFYRILSKQIALATICPLFQASNIGILNVI
jgi:hypothetical protein